VNTRLKSSITKPAASESRCGTPSPWLQEVWK
jgi:hypothetical protein